jgi:hypothetical protein
MRRAHALADDDLMREDSGEPAREQVEDRPAREQVEDRQEVAADSRRSDPDR